MKSFDFFVVLSFLHSLWHIAKVLERFIAGFIAGPEED